MTRLYESHPQVTDGFKFANKDVGNKDVIDIEDIKEDERDIIGINYSLENNYQCAYCFTEIGNKYLSCKGCEAIGRSFNICVQCFKPQTLSKSHLFVDIEKLQDNPCCNHVPSNAKNDKVDTQNGRVMADVDSVSCVTCESEGVCHNCYYVRYRFYNDQSMKSLETEMSQYQYDN